MKTLKNIASFGKDVYIVATGLACMWFAIPMILIAWLLEGMGLLLHNDKLTTTSKYFVALFAKAFKMI